jgi:hypothetical protein
MSFRVLLKLRIQGAEQNMQSLKISELVKTIFTVGSRKSSSLAFILEHNNAGSKAK